MSNKRTRTAILQWLIPSVTLLGIVVTMLINFSITSKQEAITSVQGDFTAKTLDYADDLKNEVDIMTRTAVPVTDLLSGDHIQLNELEMPIVSTLLDTSDAYLVLIIDKSGKGVTAEGRQVNVSEEPWYADMNKLKQQYYYTKQDSVMAKSAIVSAIPIIENDEYEGSILLYYATDNFKHIIKQIEYDNDNFYVLIDKEGNIILNEGKHSIFAEGDNFFDTLEKSEIYDGTIEKTKLRVSGQLTGSVGASLEEESKRLTYVPLGINGWALVSGINQSYMDELVSRYWSKTESIIYKLILAICVFIGLIVIINVISRIRSLEHSKTLEDKADTDLLTELNNKIATERKIKEFIETHPNSQSLMFLLDIDNFKKINDTMGHAFGDEVLRTLGLQIKAEFRVSDIIGRSGGDEFTIFLKNLPDDSVIAKEAEKVERFFKNFKAGEYVKYSATASIGCAVFPRDGADFEALYKAADKALYKAKKRGKNQLAFYDDGDVTENLDNVSSKDIR